MKNLAGLTLNVASREAIAELTQAKIDFQPHNDPQNEVQAGIIGELHGWKLTRAWYYWVASGGDRVALSIPEAHALKALCGGRVRPNGHGLSEIYPNQNSVDLFHIDTQEGLDLFASYCRYRDSSLERALSIPPQYLSALRQLEENGGILRGDVWLHDLEKVGYVKKLFGHPAKDGITELGKYALKINAKPEAPNGTD